VADDGVRGRAAAAHRHATCRAGARGGTTVLCGVRATPTRTRCWGELRRGCSAPATSTRPASGSRSPASTRSRSTCPSRWGRPARGPDRRAGRGRRRRGRAPRRTTRTGARRAAGPGARQAGRRGGAHAGPEPAPLGRRPG
jgi:hypothetical protein